MSEPFLGEIRMFGSNFAPRGWALCDGQLLAISSNTALFSLLGTTYGGDGRTTFGLPDLRGRFPMHVGNGPGLTPRPWGQKSGAESVTLTVAEMPQHGHAVTADPGNTSSPVDNLPAESNDSIYATGTSGSVGPKAGGNQPHNNMPPFQTVHFIIALQGIFPSRS